ncbi:hypothetical protein JCM19037_4472 [Geomicrobium sp. JCM 19037]|uniref:MBL fold metallo-hydrolase n=1 Tax=unclassified Geomicrobium TaxID=2628951 RepID=UPI00045F2C26|nr:MBL fold metallo-hydrolase [Geomicrobium sp. JCM 19037]GAK05934.1 hypothetical protein JCM19037_4472 [Geomicrobium sp. JCM 19037]
MLEELGIQSLRLNLPLRLNHVNVFLAEGVEGWTIIDAGLHNDETVAAWAPLLKGKDITNIIVTHYHPDHFGYAGALQQKTGAQVWMTETDAKAGLNAWTPEFLDEMYAYYLLAGIPEHDAQEMKENTASFIPRINPLPTINHHIVEGQRFVLGGFEYEAIFTPGHSDGLIVLYNRERNVLLSTDHLLPKITPNISYWFHGRDNPLKDYLTSLEKIKKLDADLVVPSHGKPFHGANERIDEIAAHHDERLERVYEYVKEPVVVHDVCAKLFPKVLTVHETRFAIGETLAHLEYLRDKQQIARHEENGSWKYYRV